MPIDAAPRTYTEQEVAEILKRAMAQGLKAEALSHDDLVEMARELDIDPRALEAACADVARAKAEDLARRTESEELSAERARCFFGFLSSIVTYAVVNAGLFFVNTRYLPGAWFYWVLSIWGVVLLFKLRAVIWPQRSLERRKMKELRRRAREQRRLERQKWRARMRAMWAPPPRPEIVEQSARQFEAAVQNGVAALLALAASKIQAHLDEKAGGGGRSRGRP
jgi:hypothetical protein